MTPSEFWCLTIDEWWWWLESVIPESFKHNADMLEMLEDAEEKYNNGQ
jgi:hypothetical protein